MTITMGEVDDVEYHDLRQIGQYPISVRNSPDCRLHRPGSKHHIINEAQGIPLAVILTGANRNDITQLLPLVEAIPPIRGKRGRLLCKPRIVLLGVLTPMK